MEYDYEIIYRKGSFNYASNALSRTSEKLNSIASKLSIVETKKRRKARRSQTRMVQTQNAANQKQTIGKPKLANKR